MDKEKVKSLVNEAIRGHYDKMFDYLEKVTATGIVDNIKEMLNSLEYRRYVILNAIDAEGEHCNQCGQITDTVHKYESNKIGKIWICNDCYREIHKPK